VRDLTLRAAGLLPSGAVVFELRLGATVLRLEAPELRQVVARGGRLLRLAQTAARDADIRRRAETASARAVARDLGISHPTVLKVLGAPPEDHLPA
jgi:hypothetical protein